MIRYLIALCLLFSVSLANAKITSVKQLENGIVLDFNRNVKENIFKRFVLEDKGEIRYVYDVSAELLGAAKVFDFQEKISIKVAQNSKQKVRIVITLPRRMNIDLKVEKKQASFKIPNVKKQMDNISIAALFNEKVMPPKQLQTETNQATSKAPQQSSFTKGKVIVLDPGHGGKDCGAISVEKVCEKTIVLNISKYLNDELKKRGYKVHMTRQNDVFIGLRERTTFANNKNADLFISVHANAVAENKQKLEGVESYFLSTARSERAKKVAALENKDDTEVMNYFSRQSFLNTLNTQRIVALKKLVIHIQYGMLQSLRGKFQQVG